MKKKCIQTFKNIGFQYKLLLITLFVGLVPVILLGLFSYFQMRQQMIERETTALKETLNQESMYIDYKLNSYIAAVDLIVWDNGIHFSLSRDYANTYEMYITYRDIIDPVFLSIRTMHEAVDTLTIYSNSDIYPHGDILKPLAEIEALEWYQRIEVSSIPTFYFTEDQQTLYLVCQLYNTRTIHTSIVCMAINAQDVLSSLTTIYDGNYGTAIADMSNHLLWRYDQIDSPYMNEHLTFNPETGLSESYVMESLKLSTVPWEIYLYRPVQTISNAIRHITFLVLCMIGITLLIIVLASLFLTRITVKPIIELSENMKQIEDYNMQIFVSSDSNDEIGQLIQTFTHMVKRMEYMINEILQSRIKQQEYEMKALQAQINPHFLYNSLSMINSKAIIYGQEDISRMAQLLSSFYRTTLNGGKNTISVKHELENVCAYIDIQKMMHSNSFDVVYDIDSSIYHYMIPNLLIQPLAENAILHGLDHKTTAGKGVLTLCAIEQEDALLFKVMDNGCGMSEDLCQDILCRDTSGYGLKNVNQRIQLFCGTSFGLSCTSTPGSGSCFYLRIKKVLSD